MGESAVASSTIFVRPVLSNIFPTHFNWLWDMYERVLAQPRADDDRLPVAHPRLRPAPYCCPSAQFLFFIPVAESSYADRQHGELERVARW